MILSKGRQTLLLVDDEPTNLRVLKNILNEHYRLVFARSGADALRLVDSERPELILLDVMMPDMTGFEVCQQLKSRAETRNIPVIFVTALKDDVDEAKGFELGAVDYIIKPISPPVVRARVKTHLSLVQSDELRRTRLQIIQMLGRAAEFKDNETGMHVLRMSHYSQVLALAYGFSEAAAENLLNAAPMHDIGKIGIPDHILMKPGRLTDEEMDVMREHPQIGFNILSGADSDLLELAGVVALTHHEKWDGSGYPKGLAGEDIPIEGRIVAVADVFDALTSERPYKSAWSIEKTLAFMQSQAGLHFDPKLVQLLEAKLPELLAIKQRWQDDSAPI